MARTVPIGKLQVEINPEMISTASKIKKLDVCAIWIALRTIDKHKQGTGKFTLNTCLEIVREITKCNNNYSYEIFKKGINLFWQEPTGAKGSKVVYLYGINKVIETMSFEISKTQPFLIKMEDLFKHDNSNELKAFLCSFVIARYGQNKPITIKSLETNLGISSSTVKRRINSSESITKKKNYCFLDKQFDNIGEAYEYYKKAKIMFKESAQAIRILQKDGKYLVAQQMGNSYSCEDFSRGKISKRPKSFRIIDAENRDTFKRKKFFYTKAKNVVDKDLILSKVKSPNENFYVWKMVNPDSETIEELNEKPQGHTAEVWQAAKKWSKRNKECN